MASKTFTFEYDDEAAFSVDDFASAALSLVKRQGRVAAAAYIRQALSHPKGGAESAFKTAVSILSQGADDSWSGRANDMRRAFYDGQCSVAKDVVSDYFYDGKINPVHLDV